MSLLKSRVIMNSDKNKKKMWKISIRMNTATRLACRIWLSGRTVASRLIDRYMYEWGRLKFLPRFFAGKSKSSNTRHMRTTINLTTCFSSDDYHRTIFDHFRLINFDSTEKASFWWLIVRFKIFSFSKFFPRIFFFSLRNTPSPTIFCMFWIKTI